MARLLWGISATTACQSLDRTRLRNSPGSCSCWSWHRDKPTSLPPPFLPFVRPCPCKAIFAAPGPIMPYFGIWWHRVLPTSIRNASICCLMTREVQGVLNARSPGITHKGWVSYITTVCYLAHTWLRLRKASCVHDTYATRPKFMAVLATGARHLPHPRTLLFHSSASFCAVNVTYFNEQPRAPHETIVRLPSNTWKQRLFECWRI